MKLSPPGQYHLLPATGITQLESEFKKLSNVISLTRVLKRKVQCHGFIKKSANQKTSHCFEGSPADNLSNGYYEN